MVAIKPAQIEHLISSPPDHYAAYLIYGPDLGLISERAAKLASSLQQKEPSEFEILRITDDDFAENPDRLMIDLKTVSMFGARKIIRLQLGPKISPTVLKNLLEEAPFEADLIIEGGDLKKTNPMRKSFDAAKNAASIACYADKAGQLKTLIHEVLSSYGLSIEADAEQLLMSRLGGDRALSRQEIERLALYALDKETITRTHIEDVSGNVSDLQMDHIITGSLLGNSVHAMRQMDRLLASGTAPTVLFLTLLRHVQQLHRAACDLDQGLSLEAVLNAQRPPLYYERRDNFAKQLRAWPVAKLSRTLQKIETVMAESRMRANPVLEKCSLENLLLALSQQAQR